MGWLQRALQLVGWASTCVALTACCNDAVTTAPPATARRIVTPHPPFTAEPTGWLRLLREQRVAATPRRPAAPVVDDEQAEDAREQDDGEPVFVEGEVRQVRVRTHVLATIEDVARAMLRNVEAQRPRGLFEPRMLVRQTGIICDCDGSEDERRRVRKHMRALVARARPGIKACIGEDLAADPRVVVKAPISLVVQQARRFDSTVYEIEADLLVDRDGISVRGLDWTGSPMTVELSQCLESALVAAGRELPWLATPHRVQVPIVAFSQEDRDAASESPSLSRLHEMLALYAAAYGWQHYERGELAEALEYFRDAHWSFHMVEYRYLEAMVLERIGDRRAAAARYEEFLAERPHAPEAPRLPARIAALRGDGIARADP